jgi:hypothetical protein
VEIPEGEALTFLTGMRTMTTAGDVNTQVGLAVHYYLVTAPMQDEYFYSADSEFLIVPQSGGLEIFTELGRMEIRPLEIAVVPRGMVFRVKPLDGPARGFVCENYGAKFDLPSRGPIGANCLANPRDFKTPVAAYEDVERPSKLIVKWCGQFHATEIGHSPLDVVAWHGNYAPCKYDLRTFSPVGAILFDHPDPSHLHGPDRAFGRGGHREHRLRDLPAALAACRGHLPPALVPQEHHVRVHGQHPRPVRRQAPGLRPRRHVAAQHDAAARPGCGGVREGLERWSSSPTSSTRPWPSCSRPASRST